MSELDLLADCLKDATKERDELAAALEQARKRELDLIELHAKIYTRIEQLEAALKVYEGIVAESRGVDGWHLNGDIAEWDEFDLPQIDASVSY